MDVHPENQQRTRQLLQLFHNVFVTLAGRNHLVDPAGKRVGTRRRHLQAGSLRRGNQFAARTLHLHTQFADVTADLRPSLHDRLVHLMFHLVLDRRRNLVHQLHHVRTQLAGLGIDNLEFFLYADGEAVSHGWPSGFWLPGDFARIIPQRPSLCSVSTE